MQHLGPLAILSFWLSVLFVLKKWGYDLDKTLSDHVVVGRPRKLFLFAVLVSMTALFIHAVVWLLPAITAEPITYVLFVIAYVSKIITALIPRLNSFILLHDVAASTLGTALFFVIVTIAFASEASSTVQSILRLVVLCMFVLGVSVLRRERRKYLMLQGLYYALFSFAYVYVTYF